MSKIKAKSAGLLSLVDSDNEEDQLVAQLPSPDTSLEAMPVAKKGRAKAQKTAGKSPIAPTKVTKTKAQARRLSGRGVSKNHIEPKSNAGRKALADKTNWQADEDFDDLDVAMEDAQDEGAAKKGKGSISQNKMRISKANSTTRTAPKAAAKEVSKRGRPAKKDAQIQQAPEKVVPETQLEEEMDNGEEIEEEEEEIDETIVAPPKRKPTKSSEADASDLKRQLAEMTKKYNSLSTKYDQLRDVGVKQAEINFDNFKKDSEARSKCM